jgi:hypothetical protein
MRDPEAERPRPLRVIVADDQASVREGLMLMLLLGLQLGDAPVIRNAGGRVTPAVIDNISYLAFLAGELFVGQLTDDTLFEVAIIHHTQCGTGLLAFPGFRHQAAAATGLPETALEASAAAEPHTTVKADVERLLTSPLLSPKVSVPATSTTSRPDASPPPTTPRYAQGDSHPRIASIRQAGQPRNQHRPRSSTGTGRYPACRCYSPCTSRPCSR